MSAFVVHDLKNLVAQLSLMLKNAERHRDNPEFQRDMLATVEHVVGRMNQLMLQLRTGADAGGKAAASRTWKRVVRRVCAAQVGRPAQPIELDLAPGVVDRRPRGPAGPRDRPPRPERARRDGGGGQRDACGSSEDAAIAVVEVIDTGVGMSARVRPRAPVQAVRDDQAGRDGHRRLRKRAIRRRAGRRDPHRQHARRRAPACACCCRRR